MIFRNSEPILMGNLELQVGRVWRHFTLKAWDFVYLQRLDCIMYVVL